jgi:biotin operon repressor
MTITHITIPLEVLKLRELSLHQKAILALVLTFPRGLMLSNKQIGELFGISASRVSHLLAKLEKSGDIRIENRQSRYRRIYFAENSKVKLPLLCQKQQSKAAKTDATLLSTQSTLLSVANKSKGNNKLAHRIKKTLCDNGAFDRFWSVYPKKVDKAEAQKVWAKLNPSKELVEQIVAAVERQKLTRQWLEENGRYVPNPTTWLNQQRWTDELPEPKRGDPDWLPDEQEAEAIMKDTEL